MFRFLCQGLILPLIIGHQTSRRAEVYGGVAGPIIRNHIYHPDRHYISQRIDYVMFVRIINVIMGRSENAP